MTAVEYLGKSYNFPDYNNPNIDFSNVYQTLSSWHSSVRPEFDETVGEIGSTIDDIRNATKQLEANASRLKEEEFAEYQKKATLFSSFFKRFQDTQSHAHTLLGQIHTGIVFLDRPPLSRIDVVTLQHLDPAIKVRVEGLQAVAAQYLEELKKIQSSVTVTCQHFDKRIGDLSRPLDTYLKTVAAKGQVGYLSWGWQTLSHMLFKPTLGIERSKLETMGGEAEVVDSKLGEVELKESAPIVSEATPSTPEAAIGIGDSKKKEGGAGFDTGSNLTRRQRKALARGGDR